MNEVHRAQKFEKATSRDQKGNMGDRVRSDVWEHWWNKGVNSV